MSSASTFVSRMIIRQIPELGVCRLVAAAQIRARQNAANCRWMLSAGFPSTGEEAVRAERKISLASSSVERPRWAAQSLNRVLVFRSSCRIVKVAMLSMLSLLAERTHSKLSWAC
jgi:hypothetical protein